MRIQNKATITVCIAIILSALALAFMSPDEFYIATPGLACLIMAIWLWMVLWDRDRKIPFFDMGMMCAIATLVYTIYPLVNFWADGLQFGALSDGRLQAYNISPVELGLFHWRHVLYLLFFVLIYAAFRGKGTIETGNVIPPSRPMAQTIFICFLALACFFYVLQLVTGVNFNTSYETDAFTNNLNAFANMPLLLLQICTKLNGISFIFKLALLLIVINRCKQKKWLIILFIWIMAEIIQTFVIKGSRTSLVLFLISAALLYHRMIKPFSMKFLSISGAALFVFFIFMGLYRTYTDLSSLQMDLSQVGGSIFSGSNEFQALLGTAYDVLQRKAEGAVLPWYLYINDFITIMPPQQLMPFEKISASEWYLRELGISGTGQGFMWGVITQSIAGLDWLELPVRGAILGYILACLHRWYLKHQSGFLETLFYVYLCINIYYTFRDTTFSVLANIAWEFIPFYILFKAGVAVLSRNHADTPGIKPSCSIIIRK